MYKKEVHFVGGPRDGWRLNLETTRDYYEFGLFPEASVEATFHPNAPIDRLSTFSKFTYRRFRIEYETWVFIPEAWFNRFSSTLREHVIKRLLRGYIGNPQ